MVDNNPVEMMRISSKHSTSATTKMPACMLENELARWFENEDNGDQELKRAEARLVKPRQMEENLQRLAIEEGISFQDFREHREHRAVIEAERAKLNDLIETIRSRRNLVKADFQMALNLAKQLDFLYDKATFAEKRLLCETVLRRVHIKDGKIIRTELNSPFALIASSSSASGSESFQFSSAYRIRTGDLLLEREVS